MKNLKGDLTAWVGAEIRETRRRFVKYDTKRNPEHYAWTALRLARRMSYPEILAAAPPYGEVDEATVRKGVCSVLKVLDLRDLQGKRREKA